MQTGDGALEFPLPWAVSADTSFVRTTEDYRKMLEACGFRIEHERGRHQFALEEMQRRMARGPSGAPPVIGVHILMGEKAPMMLKNVNQAIVSGQLEPVEIVAVVG
jgi:hypothetical protein